MFPDLLRLLSSPAQSVIAPWSFTSWVCAVDHCPPGMTWPLPSWTVISCSYLQETCKRLGLSIVIHKFPTQVISKSHLWYPPRVIIRIQHAWHRELLPIITLLDFLLPISLDWDIRNTAWRQWLWLNEYLFNEWTNEQTKERMLLLFLHTTSSCGQQQVLSGKREKVEGWSRCTLWWTWLLCRGMVMRTVLEQVSQTLATPSVLLLLSYVVSSKSFNLLVPVVGRFAMR